MKNLIYTYLIPRAENDRQKRLNEKLILWIKRQKNIRFIEIKDKNIKERNKFQITAILNSEEDLEKAKNELSERIKKHFRAIKGQIIYLSDKKIGQIYNEEKNRPYLVIKNYTSNNKIVILQITTRKHKIGVQHKIKLNGHLCYVIIDEPLTLNKNDIYNARSEITKLNENIITIGKFDKFVIFHKFRRAFR